MEGRGATWAVLLAALALVLGVGGVSFAGAMVTGASIQDNTVTGADVKNGSLQASDLSSAAASSLAPDAYTTSLTTPTAFTADSGMSVLSLSVPPGSYSATLTAMVTLLSGQTQGAANCSFGAFQLSAVPTISLSSDTPFDSVSMQVTGNPTAQSPFELFCFGEDVVFLEAKITATTVGSVTTQ